MRWKYISVKAFLSIVFSLILISWNDIYIFDDAWFEGWKEFYCFYGITMLVYQFIPLIIKSVKFLYTYETPDSSKNDYT